MDIEIIKKAPFWSRNQHSKDRSVMIQITKFLLVASSFFFTFSCQEKSGCLDVIDLYNTSLETVKNDYKKEVGSRTEFDVDKSYQLLSIISGFPARRDGTPWGIMYPNSKLFEEDVAAWEKWIEINGSSISMDVAEQNLSVHIDKESALCWEDYMSSPNEYLPTTPQH